MKYNKREQKAVDVLAQLAENLKDGKQTWLESGDLALLESVLGISFAGTKSAKEVKQNYTMVKGKEDLMMGRSFYVNGWSEQHYYFPFQLKRKEEKGA
ncbi:hypothetical protein JKA13_23975 [Vibrio parahaemolyticus]|uniref:hypothetical protein n=1 Tax=Vibrio parahaemolyticus TaxID=670 RepID=UPI001AA1BFC1|nr:hypothetical protein [Vibrio parahaemolyticus]